MKADLKGGPTDQFAARIGYLLPTQRRQAGKPANQTCSTCDKSAFETYTNGWGGCNARLRCGHPAAPGEKGVITKENAVCDCWARKSEQSDPTRPQARYAR